MSKITILVVLSLLISCKSRSNKQELKETPQSDSKEGITPFHGFVQKFQVKATFADAYHNFPATGIFDAKNEYNADRVRRSALNKCNLSVAQDRAA